MEQNTFDASNILSKLRQNRPAPSPSPTTDKLSGHHVRAHHSPLQRNRFQRKERPEVRIELENEVDYLTSEVARLKRENKQLQFEKEELEIRNADIKEKSDQTISKLRNKLVALNRKFNEGSAISVKDKYTAKKNLQKSFSKGAGVININNSQPPTVPTGSTSSVQNLTFSQYMKRNSHNDSEEFNSSLRHYHQNVPRDYLNLSAPPVSSLSDDIPQPSNSVEDDFLNIHNMTHHTSSVPQGVSSGQNRSGQHNTPTRSKSIVPQYRSVEEIRPLNKEYSQMSDRSDIDDENNSRFTSNPNCIDESEHHIINECEDLPIVEIDLRSS